MYRKFFSFAFFLAMGVVLSNCSDEDENSVGMVNLKVTASGSNIINTGGRLSGGRLSAEIVISEFKIAIRDIAFKNDDDENADFDTMEIKFRGPYILDLLVGGDAIEQSLGAEEIPDGTYQELRFKMHKDTDLPATDPLFDRSIYLAGTIDGTPFEMWHDTSENLDVGRSTGVVVSANTVNMTVNFTIDQFLNSQNQIDLADAQDGNGDGLIEISTEDDDGNNDLADALKDNIKAAADLLDE